MTITQICNPLQNHVLSTKLDLDFIMQEYELADTYYEDEELQIDMLIGSDYYWEIVGQVIKKIPGYPIISESKYGVILHGPVKQNYNHESINQ